MYLKKEACNLKKSNKTLDPRMDFITFSCTPGYRSGPFIMFNLLDYRGNQEVYFAILLPPPESTTDLMYVCACASVPVLLCVYIICVCVPGSRAGGG